MKFEPQQEHRWLEKLLGEWTYETEAVMEPGKPPVKASGTESVRSLGSAWVLCEGRGEMPDGNTATTVMTLGYDPKKGRYVGTYIGSMMAFLWVYDGGLDPSSKVLTLDTEGPGFSGDGKLAKYKDIVEIKDDDHRVLRSEYLGDDGEWHSFMTMTYRRVG